MTPFSNSRAGGRFGRTLLQWYDHHRRDLPWRKTRNPYRIWISEIMLQQTRVAAVLDHYHSFLKRFPDLHRLAAAPESSVLAAWSGLGYYRRARSMRLCARAIVDHHGGRFPRSADELQALPGLGRYTAAAIASIAFDQAIAVVDGNVKRVLGRLGGCQLSPKECWTAAQSVLSCVRPGDHNQAMMELGATVCTPRAPKCDVCPVAAGCATRGQLVGSSSEVALRAGAAAPPRRPRQHKIEVRYALHQRDGKVRLVKRPATEPLMAGMWELPSALPSNSYAVWRTFRHSITSTDYVVHVFRQSAVRKGRWIRASEIPQLPITGLARKILKAAGII